MPGTSKPSPLLLAVAGAAFYCVLFTLLSPLRLLDVRSREEFDAVRIAGSALMTQETMRQILGDGSNTKPLVIVDHQGKTGLDAAAYFMGHGLKNVRCLRGGIDAWSQEVDTTVRRYKLG